MFTSVKHLTATTRPDPTTTQQLTAAYQRFVAAPGTGGQEGDAMVAQLWNDLIANFVFAARVANVDLRSQDSIAQFVINTISGERRDTVLVQIIQGVVARAGTTFAGLSDTDPISSAVYNQDVYVKSDGRVGYRPRASSQIRVENRPPTVTDTVAGGALWIYGGHTFIHRGQVGSQQVWDVSGIWATARMGFQGTVSANGIYAPEGYTGDGWARFTVARQRGQVWDYEFRSTGQVGNYSVQVQPVSPSHGGGNFVRFFPDMYVNSMTASSLAVLAVADNGNRRGDVPHAIEIKRIGRV